MIKRHQINFRGHKLISVWGKFEEAINHLLSILAIAISNGLKRLTPKVVLNFNQKISVYLKSKLIVLKNIQQVDYKKFFIHILLIGKHRCIWILREVTTFIAKIIYNIKTNKLNFLFQRIKTSGTKFQITIFDNLKNHKISFTVLGSIFIISSIIFYQNIIVIYNHLASKKPIINTFSDESLIPRNTKYFNLSKKTVTLDSIFLALPITNKLKVESLSIDISIISSNRYIANYIYNNEHIVRNHINSNLRTVVRSFPLKLEGKDILRKKILNILNQMIIKLNIKGEIKEVTIQNILAG